MALQRQRHVLQRCSAYLIIFCLLWCVVYESTKIWELRVCRCSSSTVRVNVRRIRRRTFFLWLIHLKSETFQGLSCCQSSCQQPEVNVMHLFFTKTWKKRNKNVATEIFVLVFCSSCWGKRFETKQFMQTTDWNLFTGIVRVETTKGCYRHTEDNNPTLTHGKQKQ